jgi:hypothetical protein
MAVQAVEVPVDDDLHGQLPWPTPAEQLLAPGFQLVDQRLLLLARLYQGGPLLGIGRLLVALADTPSQVCGRLPQPGDVVLHEPELLGDRCRWVGGGHERLFPSSGAPGRGRPA